MRELKEIIYIFILLDNLTQISEALPAYLNSQTECVKDDENEHDIFEPSGIDDIPELILVVVFWNISPQWTSFQSVLHALTLLRTRQNRQTQSTHSANLEQFKRRKRKRIKLE